MTDDSVRPRLDPASALPGLGSEQLDRLMGVVMALGLELAEQASRVEVLETALLRSGVLSEADVREVGTEPEVVARLGQLIDAFVARWLEPLASSHRPGATQSDRDSDNPAT